MNDSDQYPSINSTHLPDEPDLVREQLLPVGHSPRRDRLPDEAAAVVYQQVQGNFKVDLWV